MTLTRDQVWTLAIACLGISLIAFIVAFWPLVVAFFIILAKLAVAILIGLVVWAAYRRQEDQDT